MQIVISRFDIPHHAVTALILATLVRVLVVVAVVVVLTFNSIV